MITSLNRNPGGLISLLIFFLISFTAIPQEKMKEPSVDKSIRYGKLENGFTYYIKNSPKSQSKIHMRLLSKAGYDQHDPDQLNTAHAVEHLAFKATRNFPEGISYSPRIQKLGVGLYDKLAYSGPKGVTYYFDAPPGSPEALEAGLLFFKDIATGLKLTDKDINSVRGELRQEFLEGKEDLELRAAESRLSSKIFPCSQDGSNYIEYQETFDPEVLRRFYKDWYRPDLLAIIVVGHINDMDELEKRIRGNFSALKPSVKPRKVRNCDSLYFKQSPQFHIVERPARFSDEPDRRIDLQLIFRDPFTEQHITLMEGEERLLLLNMLISALNRRFRDSDSLPFLKVGARNIYFYENYPVSLSIEGEVEDPGFKKGLHTILNPILQLQKYGVSQAEWKQIKQGQMELLRAEYEQGYRYWINEIKDHFFLNEPLPDNKQDRLQSWLSRLTIQEFNQYLQRFLKKEPEDLGIIIPEGHPIGKYTEFKIRSWIEKKYKEPIERYTAHLIPERLLKKKEVEKLKEFSILESQRGVSGAEEFILSNGLRLVIKPLKPSPGMNQDKIMIHGYTRKGANCFKKEDFFSAVHAPRIVNALGVGDWSKAEIDRFLESQEMIPGVVSFYVDRHDSGIQAKSTPGNLENVLQLIYLHMTSPNKSPAAFNNWKVENQRVPQGIYKLDFYNTVESLTGKHSVIRELFGRKYPAKSRSLIEGVRQVKLHDAIDLYKQIFSNAKDFTFVISGNFKTENILPLFQKYLGNVPSSGTLQNCSFPVNCPASLPEGKISFQMSAPELAEMKNVKYGMRFITPSEDPFNWKEQLKVEALGILTRHILWKLRFKEGFSIYGIIASGKLNQNFDRYEISSFLECMPEEFPEIQKEVYKLLSDLKTDELPKESFSVGMKKMYRLYDADKGGSTHRERHNNLYRHYRYKQPWIDPVEAENFVKSLTPKDMMEAAQKYMRDEGFYEFVMQDASL